LALFREGHEKLLEIFMSMDDFTFGDARRGVRRAQVMLAAFYLSEKQVGQALKLKHQLDRGEDRDLMISLKEELSCSSSKEFWEVSERGSNFSYVEPKLRQQLPQFFGWFPWYQECEKTEAKEKYWAGAEGKKLKVQQELTNFDTADSIEGDDDDEGVDEEESAAVDEDISGFQGN
jgi:hypothetical protein